MFLIILILLYKSIVQLKNAMKIKGVSLLFYDFFVQVQQVTVKILSLEGKVGVGQIILFFWPY